MEKTRVDLIVNGKRLVFRDGLVGIEMVDHGQWKIDDVPGKTLCRMVVRIPQKGIAIDFVPSHEFCERFIDGMLEAEHNNDTFIFENPKVDDTRPMQFESKLKRLAKVLKKWQDRKLSPQMKLKM